MDAIGALRAALDRDPHLVAVLVDFDGTLSPIVLEPESAVPLPGAAEVLLALSARLGRMAVVSGRPVSFLAEHLPEAVDLVGLYGLEARRGGRLVEHPDARGWRPVVDEVVAAARADLEPEVEVEDKGLSVTLHVRRHPERAEDASGWARTAAARWGLLVRSAKRSVELHPPVATDKGTVVDELTAGLAAAVYVGDDLGDLPAFVGLDRFAAAGGASLRVAVVTDEAPDELVAAADLQVEGPEGALAFLRSLLS